MCLLFRLYEVIIIGITITSFLTGTLRKFVPKPVWKNEKGLKGSWSTLGCILGRRSQKPLYSMIASARTAEIYHHWLSLVRIVELFNGGGMEERAPRRIFLTPTSIEVYRVTFQLIGFSSYSSLSGMLCGDQANSIKECAGCFCCWGVQGPR